MKKAFYIIIVTYILGGIILILIAKDKPSLVKILSYKQNYSRLLTDEENIDIPLFLNEQDTFLTKHTNITSAFLITENYQIRVNITDIRNTDSQIIYKDEIYNQYYLQIDFIDIGLIDTYVNLEDAILNINYLNEESLDIEVGNLSLMFQEIITNNHLELMHLFGIVNPDESGTNYLRALGIKLENLSNQSVEIIDISINLDNIYCDLSYSEYIDKPPLPNEDLNTIINDYNPLEVQEDIDFTLLLNSNAYLIIPIKYSNSMEPINRFPIIITYKFNSQEFQYIIDDFLFFDQNLSLEPEDDRIQKYEYRYPTS
jgi:phage anti-repressor protein